MRLLDLFSGAGGSAVGYYRAGFTEIVGVDHAPMPRYPFEFVQADALQYLAEHGREFDVIHASPPCQRYSEATPVGHKENHPDLIDPTREALRKIGKPYVIENVSGARHLLLRSLMLCGTMFGLPIWRHRYFEIEPIFLMSPATCNHNRRPITVHSGSNSRKTWEPVLVSGGGDGKRAKRKNHRPRESVDVIRWAMEIDWMTTDELHEAIPPAYTEYIGLQLLRVLAEAGE